MEPEGEWSILVENLAETLVPALRRRLRRPILDRLRSLKAPSEKLVYIYLVETQPQTFITIRRSLGLGRMTVNRALKDLMNKGYVVQDSKYLYWTENAE